MSLVEDNMSDEERFETTIHMLLGYIERQAPDPAEGKRIIEAILDARGFVPEKVNSWHDAKTDPVDPSLSPDAVLCIVDDTHAGYATYKGSISHMFNRNGDKEDYLIANRTFAQHWGANGFITHWMEIPDRGDK